MSQRMIANDWLAIRKRKVTLTLQKPAYAGICLLVLTKVLMHEFHCDYIKNKMVTTQDYYSLILIVWCMKSQLKMFMKILVRIKNV